MKYSTVVYFLVLAGRLLAATAASSAVNHPLLEPARFKADLIKAFTTPKDSGWNNVTPHVRVLSVVRRHLDDSLPDIVSVKAIGSMDSKGSRLEGYRSFAFVDNDEHQVLYDSSPFQVECASPDINLGDQKLFELDDKKILELEVVTYHHPCCGASEEEDKTSYFFDAQDKFKRLLEFQSSHVYFGYSDCSSEKEEGRKRSMQLTWLHPNGCSGESCGWLDVKQWTYAGPKWAFKGVKWGSIEWSKDKTKLELKYDRK